jgi:hypothetical protein
VAAGLHFSNGQKIELLGSLGGAVLNAEGNLEVSDFDLSAIGVSIGTEEYSLREQKIANFILRMSSVESASSLKNFLAKVFKRSAEIFLGALIKEAIQSPRGIGFDERFKLRTSTTLLIGNFHTYHYVREGFEKDLKLMPRNSQRFEHYLEIMQNTSISGIHVRLGDYLSIDELNVLTSSYYRNAVSLLEEQKNDHRYFIFTNDQKAVFSYLPRSIQNSVHYVDDSLSSAETLELMRHCKNLVIANSTFSWWGGFVTKIENSRVISPARWFRSRSNPVQMCPPTWIQLTSE